MTRLACLLGAVALAATTLPAAMPAHAQSDAAAQALIDRLRPSTGGGTRGIRIPGGDGGASSPAPAAPAPAWQAAPSPRPAPSSTGQGKPSSTPPTVTAAAPRPPVSRDTTSEAPSVSITVVFPTGSAALTPEAERALAPLGRALSSQDLAPFRFRVEGHTDNVGDLAQNQALSERRAQAVRAYLIQTFRVDPQRLDAVGFGASQMLVQTPPQTSEARNRRVQIVNVGN